MSFYGGKIEISDLADLEYCPIIETVMQDIQNEISKDFDNQVMTAVQRIGVKVDKEELVKALRYDRDQFRKGFEAGYREAGGNDKGFIDIDYQKPSAGDVVLVKLNDVFTPYYVCQVTDDGRFLEASGEEYSYWNENMVSGWMPIKELDRLPVVRRDKE